MADAEREKAMAPEDLGRLFVQFVQAGDFDGLATLYEEDAVMAAPTGALTAGSAAIAAGLKQLFSAMPFDASGAEPRPVLRSGDLALTSTRLGGGQTTVEVARRQADGSWRWVIDQPNA